MTWQLPRSPRAYVLVGTLAIASIDACVDSANSQTDSSSHGQGDVLHLDQVGTIALPDSFQLGGMDARDRRALTWATNEPYLVLRDREQESVVKFKNAGVPIAAALTAGGGLEVLDSGFVRRLSVDGTRKETPYSIAFRPVEGARGRAGWYVGGIDADHNLRIVRIDSLGNSAPYYKVPSARLTTQAGDTAFFKPTHMTPVGDSLLVTIVNAPFENIVIDDRGKEVRSFRPPPPPVTTTHNATEAARAAKWISLATLRLDCGFLQTLSDVRSDQRRLVLFDNAGAPLRNSEIAAPLGFIYAMPTAQRLFAVRAMSSAEIVTYRWQWTQPSNVRGETCARH
jgi:hypothetical protein